MFHNRTCANFPRFTVPPIYRAFLLSPEKHGKSGDYCNNKIIVRRILNLCADLLIIYIFIIKMIFSCLRIFSCLSFFCEYFSYLISAFFVNFVVEFFRASEYFRISAFCKFCLRIFSCRNIFSCLSFFSCLRFFTNFVSVFFRISGLFRVSAFTRILS